MRSKLISLGIALWFVAAACEAGLLAPDRIVLMRGVVADRGASLFEYAGNERTLGTVSIKGITAQETRDFNVDNLKAEVALYEAAQKLRLKPGQAAQPLHILLDPNETWCFARWGWPFRLRWPDGRTTAPDTGFIHMGEQFDFSGRVSETTDADREANKLLLEELDTYYAERFKSWDNTAFARFILGKIPGCFSSLGVNSEPFESYVASVKASFDKAATANPKCSATGFEAHVEEFKLSTPARMVAFTASQNARWNFTFDGKTGGLEVFVSAMDHTRFREKIAQLMTADLKARKAPAAVTWQAFYDKSKSKQAYAQLQRRAALAGINETLTHEVGHVIHFEATNGMTGNSGDSGDPKNRGSHSITTLSNPPFALTEGWAEAMAFTYGRHSPESTLKVATRIDYSSSRKVQREYLNGLFAGAMVARLRALGKLGASETLTIDAPEPMQLDLATFQTKVGEAARAKGLDPAEAERVTREWVRNPQLARHLRRLAYLEDLEKHKGEKKKRHDLLASEASVAVILWRLREDLGTTTYEELVGTMARARPTTLAELLESHAHAFPAKRVAIYRSLVSSTEEILVTKQQLALIEAEPRLQIDLDRNGKLPGEIAARVRPELFPAETMSFDPAIGQPGTPDPLVPTPLGPSLPAVDAAAAEVLPAQPDGMTPRPPPEESVTFDGMERE